MCCLPIYLFKIGSQSSAEGEHSSSTESQYSVPPSIHRKDISAVPEVAQQSSKVPTRAPFVLGMYCILLYHIVQYCLV